MADNPNPNQPMIRPILSRHAACMVSVAWIIPSLAVTMTTAHYLGFQPSIAHLLAISPHTILFGSMLPALFFLGFFLLGLIWPRLSSERCQQIFGLPCLALGVATPSLGLASVWTSDITFGLLVAIGLWPILGAVVGPALARPSHVNAKSWNLIKAKYHYLKKWKDHTASDQEYGFGLAQRQNRWRRDYLHGFEAAFKQLCDRIGSKEDDPPDEPQLRWVRLSGYLSCWECIWRAERALFGLVCKNDDLLAYAGKARLQLTGTGKDISPGVWQLLDEVYDWIEVQARPACGWRSWLELRSRKIPASGRRDQFGKVRSHPQAVGALYLVRRSIDSYRASRWADLARLRNRMVMVLLLLEVLGYSALVIAVSVRIHEEQLRAAVLYFLVGAGSAFLIVAVRARPGPASVDDFGFREVRMILQLYLSGLVGIAGVIVYPLLHQLASVVEGDYCNCDFGPIPIDLPKLFSYEHFPYGLVIAAIFGLTPELVFGPIIELAKVGEAALRRTDQASADGE